MATSKFTHVAGPADGPQVLIATMHGKEVVLGPRLAALGFKVLLPNDYDTDALGTFTGDVPRPGTALEVVVEKARRACLETGIPRAVASEGTYVPCQQLFPGAKNAELLAFVDLESEVDIVVHEVDLPTRVAHGFVLPDVSSPEVQLLLEHMGWPEIRAMVIPGEAGRKLPVFKGIDNVGDLADALAACASASANGRAHLCTDMRAHMNPTRMMSIAKVADSLVRRIRAAGYECGRTAERAMSH